MTGVRTRRPPSRSTTEGGVLVTDHADGNSRSAVAAVRALAAAGHQPAVVVAGRRSAAASSRACAEVVRVADPAAGSDGYVAAVREAMRTGRYSGVLAASDAALVTLGLPGSELVDKAILPDRAAAAGLRVPDTLDMSGPEQLIAAAPSLPYPVVVKPTLKVGPSTPARRLGSADAVAAFARDLSGPVVVQEFHGEEIRAVCGVVHDGELRAVAHQVYRRIWPVDCGVACAAVTVEPDLDLERRLPALLKGHAGVFQVQLIGDLLIDVNPRVYGSLPLAVAAGVNLPAIACDPVTTANTLVRGRPGVRYRWLEGDLRHITHELRHGRIGLGTALRMLVPQARTAHSVESMRDPGPALNRLREVVTKVAR